MPGAGLQLPYETESVLILITSCRNERDSNGAETEEPTNFQLLSNALYFLNLEDERIEYLESDLYRHDVHNLKVVSVVSELDVGGLISLSLITNTNETYYVRITERAFIVDIFSVKQWESIPINVSILSEILYFLERGIIEAFAIELAHRNALELTEVIIISEPDEDGWLTLELKTADGEIYYRQVNREGYVAMLYTAEQWILRNNHMDFFASKVGIPGIAASILAEASIPEIVDYEVIEDFDVEIFSSDSTFLHWPMVLFLRIEVATGEVYYAGFDDTGYLVTVRSGGIDGEDLYSPFIPGWIHLQE